MINIRHKGKIVKKLPEKYWHIVDEIESRGEKVTDYLEYEDRPWLQESERRIFDTMLLRASMEDFLAAKQKDPKLKDIVKLSKPVKILKVVTRSNVYYTAKFASGHELRCDASLFKCSPIKETVKRLY